MRCYASDVDAIVGPVFLGEKTFSVEHLATYATRAASTSPGSSSEAATSNTEEETFTEEVSEETTDIESTTSA